MSTNLRTLLQDADPGYWEPLDLGALTREARVRKRQRRILQGLAGVAVVLIASFAAPNLFRQLGIQQLETTDNPPSESNRDERLGTGELPDKGGAPALIVGAGGAGGARAETRRGAGTPQRGAAPAAGGITASPKPPGTYSYDVSGHTCGGSGCSDGSEGGEWEEVKFTFHQPTGSHQHSSQRWTSSGCTFDAEHSHDYRPDGVYLESWAFAVAGTCGAWSFACPDLPAAPARVWPTGAKPGDHFEYDMPCADETWGGSGRWSADILRFETLPVGGRDVATLVVRTVWRGGVSEGWVFPDHFLQIREHTSRLDGSDYWLMLESLTPS